MDFPRLPSNKWICSELRAIIIIIIIIIIINNRTYHHKTIKQEKVKCMGYVYDGGIQPKHWMQFAYDTAIVTALDSDN